MPTHQGRGAEHLLSQTLIKPGDVIPGNMYFTTTRLHQELAGGRFVDVIIDEAHDPASLHPFKGDVDLVKLQGVIDEFGADHIPYVCIATAVNMAGGQPISLGNLREVRELTADHGIRIILTPRAWPRTPTSSRSASRVSPTGAWRRSSSRSARSPTAAR